MIDFEKPLKEENYEFFKRYYDLSDKMDEFKEK